MSDHEAIRDLMSEYCHLLDDQNFEELAELFTEDAVVTAKIAAKTFEGRDQIRGYLEGQPPHKRGIHVTVNHRVHIEEGANAANAAADFFVIVERPHGLHLLAMGRYNDRIVRQDKRWLFAERHILTRYAEA